MHSKKKKKKKEENCKFHKQTLLESGGFVGVLPLSLQVWAHREPPLILCTQNPGSLWTTSPGAGRKAFPHPMAHLDPRLFCLEGKWHSSKTFWSFLTPHLALMSRWVKFAAKDEFAKRTQVLPAACELVSSPNSETGRASSPHTINHPFNWYQMLWGAGSCQFMAVGLKAACSAASLPWNQCQPQVWLNNSRGDRNRRMQELILLQSSVWVTAEVLGWKAPQTCAEVVIRHQRGSSTALPVLSGASSKGWMEEFHSMDWKMNERNFWDKNSLSPSLELVAALVHSSDISCVCSPFPPLSHKGCRCPVMHILRHNLV